MRDQIDLGRRRLVNVLQHLPAALSHDDQPGRERDQLLHDAPLVRPGLAQNGMQRRDHRHSQFAQERQDVTAGRPAENAELVLQADDVHVADVEEVRGAQIGRQVLLFNLEAHHIRVFVAALDVVDRDGEALALGMRSRDGSQQIGRERGDAALARQVVADEGDLADFGCFFHKHSLWPRRVEHLRSIGSLRLLRRWKMKWIPQVL